MNTASETQYNTTNNLDYLVAVQNYLEIISEELRNQSLAMTPARIRAIRKIYNLTQRAFAKLLNISYDTYRNWEIGHRHPCTAAVALLILAEKDPKLFLRRELKGKTSSPVPSRGAYTNSISNK